MEDLLTDRQIKDLVDSPARSCLIRKDHAYLPFLYVRGHREGDPQIIRANRRQLTLLSYLKDGLSIPEAAAKSQLTETQAIYFLKKKEVQAWLRNKAEEEAVMRDWTPGKWFEWGQRILDAPNDVEIPKAKIEVWREFGDRCVPKPSRNGTEGPAKVEINIDVKAAQSALDRQQAIEAQIVKEGEAA